MFLNKVRNPKVASEIIKYVSLNFTFYLLPIYIKALNTYIMKYKKKGNIRVSDVHKIHKKK